MADIAIFGVLKTGLSWAALILIWVSVLWGIIALLERLFLRLACNIIPRPPKTTLEILEERHARGEIDGEKFRRMKTHLTS